MPRSTLTGSRIRERRTLKGIKQADLARRVGISPAYLNLIEHNRRRIAGKLLVDLARELEADLVALSQGAHAPLVDGLRAAAGEAGEARDLAEVDRVEDFADRFPGWAGLVMQQRDHIGALERRVEALNDRLAHDPYLSDALHDLLSSVTAVRSTAGILNAGDDIDPEWRVRFHRNIYEDSQRLADGAQSLVTYLDTIGSAHEGLSTPLDEVEAWLAAQSYALGDDVAVDGGADPDGDVLQTGGAANPVSSALKSRAAQTLARDWQVKAAQDAALMPLDQVDAVLAEFGPDPSALARVAGVPLDAAMRRFAALPPADHRPPVGLARCDGSGTLTFRKPLDGFVLPRFGAACPLWPLYQALLRPTVPLRRVIEAQGQPARRFVAYAICQPTQVPQFDAPQIVEATMMVVPIEHAGVPPLPSGEALGVGSTCRVCVRADCAARREPSLVTLDHAQDLR
ncbi:short-chain fatty acyl-CoA regulator family protein [Celeribacter sp.]|uniref:short-chain fatty acyl-CoA regulator family protein n=1 Tax=Celeribacter sp. TaxID=1890673 RepID=UPI003A914B83